MMFAIISFLLSSIGSTASFSTSRNIIGSNISRLRSLTAATRTGFAATTTGGCAGGVLLHPFGSMAACTVFSCPSSVTATSSAASGGIISSSTGTRARIAATRLLGSSASAEDTTTTTTPTASALTEEESAVTERMRLESEDEMQKLAEHYVEEKKSTETNYEVPICWTTSSSGDGDDDDIAKFIDDEVDNLLFDCDGVVYRSPDPAPGATACIRSLISRGKKVFFVTNNASANRRQLREKLLSILDMESHELTEDMMITSSYSAAQYLKRTIIDTGADDEQKRLYAIGSEGLCEELRGVGFHVTGGPSLPDEKPSMSREELVDYDFQSKHGKIHAVVVGHDIDVNFRKLCVANVLLQRHPDAPLVATNRDSHDLVGADGRQIVGNGSIVAALEYSSGRHAINVGKPSRTLVDLITNQCNVSNLRRTMMIGDRLDTDIRFGVDYGMYTALVMTGVTDADQMIKLQSGTEREPLPTHILPHIGLLV